MKTTTNGPTKAWGGELATEQPVTSLSDAQLRMLAQRAWDCNDGDTLRPVRAEAQRRGITVS
jgi:hypothetical protein